MKKAPFNPFEGDWNPVDHAAELDGFADKLAANSAGKKGATHEDAREAAKKAKRLLVMARHEIELARRDPAAAFRAGWTLREALDVLAMWEAKIGKKLLPTKAAKAKRPKRDPFKTRLGQAIKNAWDDYREEAAENGEDYSAVSFSQDWLRTNLDAYDLESEFDKKGELIFRVGGTSEERKVDTIRKWLSR